jgi:hypothetical protein
MLIIFSTSVSVRLWKLEEYEGLDTQLPSLIDLQCIHGHLACTVVSIGEYQEKVWATINLAKVRFYLFRNSLGKLMTMTVIFVAPLTIVSRFSVKCKMKMFAFANHSVMVI